MATFTPSNTGARFTDTDGDVSFTATSARAMFTAAYQSVTGGGGGAVDSVNGQTGVVVLDADDVGAAEASSAPITVLFQHFTNLNVAAAHPFGAFMPEGSLVELIGQTNDAENGTYVAPANAATTPLVYADDQLLDQAFAGRSVSVLNALNGPYVYGPAEWIVSTNSYNEFAFAPQSGTTMFVQTELDVANGDPNGLSVDFDSAVAAGALVFVSTAASGNDWGIWRFVADGSPMVRSRIEASVGTTLRVMSTGSEWTRTPHSGWVRTSTSFSLPEQRVAHAAELAGDITNVFRFNGAATGRWSTPNLTTEFSTGISYRCLRIPRRPATVPFFAEYFTQAHDSGVGSWDNFEGADLWPDDLYESSNGTPVGDPTVSGAPRDFHEQTESGGTEDGSGWWPDLLLAADQAIETMTDITFGTGVGRKWLRVPYELNDGGTYHTDADDGAVFRLMSTFTSEKFESIDAHTEEWWLGNNYSGDIVRLIVRDGLDGTLIADPDASLVTPGATSFVDGAGNTWTGGAAAEVVELNPTGGTVDVVSNVASSRILGRVTSGSGDSEELTAAQVRALLGDPWVTITDTTLGTAAASFSVDTTGYNELEVMLSGRGDSTAGPTVGMRVQFNGDTGSNYLSNTSAASTAWNGVGTLPASQTNTDRRGLWTAKITLGHTSSETTAICVGTHRTSTSATGTVPQTLGAYYTNTSAAITSMLIFPSSGNWAAGTRLLVRGKV